MADFPTEPLKTVHFWAVHHQDAGGALIDVLRRRDLHACLPVARLLILPTACQDKNVDADALANLLCREFDRQLAEQPVST